MTIDNKVSILENCSPGLMGSTLGFTCYSVEVLNNMKNLWNIKHSDDKIETIEPFKIWDSLRKKFSQVCHTEQCWIRQTFLKGNIHGDIMKYTFAPTSPKDWSDNPFMWLSSIDITSVMSHFEKYFPQFIFIGPTPIDFDKIQLDGNCVWTELCDFNLANLLSKRKKKIGIIFNTDTHNKDGEHWISMFIDMAASPNPYIFYFDSTGYRMPKEIKKLSTRIIKQANELGIDMVLHENKKKHQKGTTECGMYSLYMIIELLTMKKTYQHFMNNRVDDESMKDLRNRYFNKPV